METSLTAILFSLNYLQICWFIGYRKFFSFKQLLLLNCFILFLAIFAFITNSTYSLILLAFCGIVQYSFIVYHLKSWALATFYYFLQNTLMVFTWLVTWDILSLLWEVNKINTEHFNLLTPWVIVTQQFLLLFSIICSKKISLKYQIFESISQLQKKYIASSIIFLILLLFLNVARRISINKIDLIHFFYLTLLVFGLTGIYCFIIYLISMFHLEKQSSQLLSKKSIEEANRLDLANEFRHDYRNILTSLISYLKQDQSKKALDYLYSIVDYSNPLIKTDYYSFISTINILPVQGLLITFFEKCDEKDIPVSFSTNQQVSPYDITINLLDFIRCFSIILDNALEASLTALNPFIQIKITTLNEMTVFEVKNSFDYQIPLEQVMKNKFTTKKNHQGKGLYIFSKLLNQYRHVSYTFKQENDLFIVSMSMQKNE